MYKSIGTLLDEYCLARCVKDKNAQIELANHFVDHTIPELLERLGDEEEMHG